MNDAVALQRQIDDLRRVVDYLTAQQEPNQELSTASSPTFANIYSGTYTPTLTNTTNIDASTAFLSQYFRVGSVVLVSSRVEVDATAAANTVLGISLPIASNFGANRDCSGTGNRNAGGAGEVRANTTSDIAEFSFTATTTANAAYYLIFAYLII